jgi:hypothetical protein
MQFGDLFCKSLKRTGEKVVEAAGVELFRVLITRNLLILGTATTAKKAPLPDPLYVYSTKKLCSGVPQTDVTITISHRFTGLNWEKHSARRPPTCHFFATPACSLVISGLPVTQEESPR